MIKLARLAAAGAMIALSAASQAAVQTVDFRGFTLKFDDTYLSLAGTAELGNDGLSYFTMNRKQIHALSGSSTSATLNPIFEVEAKPDSFLISYQGWSQARLLKSFGASIRYESRVDDDLHGGYATDERFNHTYLIHSEDNPTGQLEVWGNEFGHYYFNETTRLTIDALATIYLDATAPDSHAQFELLDQSGMNDEIFHFGLAVGSVQPVPEPETIALTALGLAILVVRRRKQQLPV